MVKLYIDDRVKGTIAYTSGILFWKKITVGKKFFDFNDDVQEAILAHEMGHVKGFHIEQKILCLILCPFALKWLFRRQEFIADEYAAKLGHASSLMKVLRSDLGGGLTHPSDMERRQRLEKYV